jgi:hypothetical protein
MVKNNRWIPTQAECDLIKAAASKESEPNLPVNALSLEPGQRASLVNIERPIHINVCLVSEKTDPKEMTSDTDLHDTISWNWFRKGVELDANGRAIVDFYIRARSPASEEAHGCSIFGNVVVHFHDGKIAGIHGVGFGHHPYPIA